MNRPHRYLNLRLSLAWRHLLGSFILATAWAAPLPQAMAAQPAQDFYLGSVAMDVPAAMVQRLMPLTRYLSQQTGLRVSFRASPNLGSAVHELGQGYTQIAYLTPVAYIEAREQYRVEPLVAPSPTANPASTWWWRCARTVPWPACRT